jgi:hypothetical protein
MGTKATFDPVAKIIQLGDFAIVDVQADLYSDAKEDWLTDLNLNKYLFPFTTIGGEDLGGGVFAGAYYFLNNDAGWKIRPFDADQSLAVVGNLYGLNPALPLFIPTVSGKTVLIQLERSSLTQQVVISTGSGLSPAQDSLLTQIGQDTDDIPADVWDESANLHNVGGSFGKHLRQIKEGVVVEEATVTDVAATTTVFITNLAESTDDHYNDSQIVFISGTLLGQSRTILAYAGATGTITLDEALTSAPADDDAFLILTGHTHPVTQIAQAVWDHTQ